LLAHDSGYAAASVLIAGDEQCKLQTLDFRTDHPVLEWRLRDDPRYYISLFFEIFMMF
jgi:hypothetical protein